MNLSYISSPTFVNRAPQTAICSYIVICSSSIYEVADRGGENRFVIRKSVF